MRGPRVLLAVTLFAVALVAVPGRAATLGQPRWDAQARPDASRFDKEMAAAMSHYYGALVASQQGNIERTQRQLLLLASTWDTVARDARRTAPDALRNDPAWGQAIDHISSAIKDAGEQLKRRDASGAHADLESIRHELEDIRAKHNLLTFDDYITDFHDAVERVVGHVAGRNEIVLQAKDFDDVAEDLAAASKAWQAVKASAGDLSRDASWQTAERRMDEALQRVHYALTGRKATDLASGIEHLRAQYQDLLLTLSHIRS